jgi:solute carrier family 44 (choline transporter-like protein), member 2/4/5
MIRILKFLSDGVFIQIAMQGTNYCVSSVEAFKLLSTNPIKISVTGAISYMVAILGIIFTTAVICTGAYFVQI